MSDQLIITLGREFGSGGHEIAQGLADHYGLPMYDHDLLKEIAARRNLDGNELAAYDEVKWNRFLYQSAWKRKYFHNSAPNSYKSVNKKKQRIINPMLFYFRSLFRDHNIVKCFFYV